MIDSAFAGVTLDPAVLAFDRRQHGTFRQSFERYAATRVTAPRIKHAKSLMQRHAALLSRIERQFGVPATLLMAIWTTGLVEGQRLACWRTVRRRHREFPGDARVESRRDLSQGLCAVR